MVPPAKVVLWLVTKDWFKMFIQQTIPLRDGDGWKFSNIQIILRR